MASITEKIARKAFRPLRSVYYRRLHGRSYPLAPAVDRWVAAREQKGELGDVPLSGDDWDAQYGRGDWDFLAAADELARRSLIAGFLRAHRPGGSVLDVGGGEGLLWDALRRADCRRYHGIDLSRVAIERATAELAAEGVSFEVADAEVYEPVARFDAIVFNECLYYFRDPVAVVERYRSALEPGGLLVTSMFEAPRSLAIGRQLDQRLATIDTMRLSNHKGAWRLALFRGDR